MYHLGVNKGTSMYLLAFVAQGSASVTALYHSHLLK